MAKAKTKGRKGDRAAVIIRREEIIEGGHHAGAWKVAYADFVTAMMAFFLLMWLINATSEKQRRGIADYFSPQGSHARSLSGSGKPFGGTTPFEKGALVSNLGSVSLTDQMGEPQGGSTDADPDAADPPPSPPAPGAAGTPSRGQALTAAPQADPDAVPIRGDSHQDGNSGRGTASADDGEAGDPVPVPRATPSAASRPGTPGEADREEAALRKAAQALRREVASDPALAGLGNQLAVDVTPEGLRIQIVDTEHAPMFDNGSAVPNPRARLLLARVAPVIASLHDPVSITGHTDSAPPLGASARSNWALSAARADATRMVLDANGLADRQVVGVTGVADRDPERPGQGDLAANRRVVIVVHRSGPPPASVR